MSLKAFHLIFISASTLLAFSFGAWCLRSFSSGPRFKGDLGLGVCSILAGVALLVYGRFFLRKLKHIDYL